MQTRGERECLLVAQLRGEVTDTTALVLATVLLNKAKARKTFAALQVNGRFAFHIGVSRALLTR